MCPFALTLLAFLTPGEPPPPPAVAVQVQSRIIRLREVPERVDQARSAAGQVEPQLVRDAEDLDQMLAALSQEARALPPLPVSWKVRRADAAEAQFLVGLVDDTTYLELRKEVEATWSAWMAITQESLSSETTRTLKPSALRDQVAQRALQRRQLLAQSNPRVEREWAANLAEMMKGVTGGRTFLEMESRTSAHHGAHTTRLEQSIVLRNTLAPSLTVPWKAMADHLNRSVETLSGLEKADAGTASPELKALRVLAKRRLLERFRSAVFQCHVVWAHMASRPLPRPPVFPD